LVARGQVKQLLDRVPHHHLILRLRSRIFSRHQGPADLATQGHGGRVHPQHRVVGLKNLVKIIAPDPGDNFFDPEQLVQLLGIGQGNCLLTTGGHFLYHDFRSLLQNLAGGVGQGGGDQMKGGDQKDHCGKDQQQTAVLAAPPPERGQGVVEEIDLFFEGRIHGLRDQTGGGAQKEPVGK